MLLIRLHFSDSLLKYCSPTILSYLWSSIYDVTILRKIGSLYQMILFGATSNVDEPYLKNLVMFVILPILWRSWRLSVTYPWRMWFVHCFLTLPQKSSNLDHSMSRVCSFPHLFYLFNESSKFLLKSMPLLLSRSHCSIKFLVSQLWDERNGSSN